MLDPFFEFMLVRILMFLCEQLILTWAMLDGAPHGSMPRYFYYYTSINTNWSLIGSIWRIWMIWGKEYTFRSHLNSWNLCIVLVMNKYNITSSYSKSMSEHLIRFPSVTKLLYSGTIDSSELDCRKTGFSMTRTASQKTWSMYGGSIKKKTLIKNLEVRKNF